MNMKIESKTILYNSIIFYILVVETNEVEVLVFEVVEDLNPFIIGMLNPPLLCKYSDITSDNKDNAAYKIYEECTKIAENELLRKVIKRRRGASD